MLKNVEARSAELLSFLHHLQQDKSLSITDVRGLGLMVAIEFGSTLGKPNPLLGIAMEISKKCAEKGLLLLSTSVFEVIRFIPPLTITADELSKGLKIFEEVTREAIANRH